MIIYLPFDNGPPPPALIIIIVTIAQFVVQPFNLLNICRREQSLAYRKISQSPWTTLTFLRYLPNHHNTIHWSLVKGHKAGALGQWSLDWLISYQSHSLTLSYLAHWALQWLASPSSTTILLRITDGDIIEILSICGGYRFEWRGH